MEEPKKSRIFEKYARNLTTFTREDKLDPVIYWDGEIKRLMQIINRRTKNNPILIGGSRRGKTTIAEGFTQRIVKGEVPASLKDKELISLDVGSLVLGRNTGVNSRKDSKR